MVTKEEFAASAASHCDGQVAALEARALGLEEKAARLEEQAAQVRLDLSAAVEAVEVMAAERDRWLDVAAGAGAPASEETVDAEAGSALGSGEAVL